MDSDTQESMLCDIFGIVHSENVKRKADGQGGQQRFQIRHLRHMGIGHWGMQIPALPPCSNLGELYGKDNGHLAPR